MSGIFCKDIAVLDVNSKTISAIIGVKKSQSVFEIKSVVEKDHQGFENGEWFDLHDTMQVAKTVLKECLKVANSKTKRIFISVPAEFLSVVTKEVAIEFDRKRLVNDEDVKFLYKKGATFNSEDYCLINTKPVYFAVDDQDSLLDNIVGIEAQSIEACVSYVLAEKSYISMFDAIAGAFQFTDIIFIGTPLAENIALLEKEDRDNVYAMIDIGFISSSITLGKGEGILDMKSFSMGGGHIAADIYEALECSYESALTAKQLVDLNLNYSKDAVLVAGYDKNIMAQDAAEITRCRLDVFVEIISNVFKELEDFLPSNMKIYLTGDGIAPIRGAKKYLSEQLGKNIEIVTPKLPGFVKAEDSSKISLLIMADTLSKGGFVENIKRLFGGKRK